MHTTPKEQRKLLRGSNSDDTTPMKGMAPPTFQLKASQDAPIQMARKKDKDKDPLENKFNPFEIKRSGFKRRRKNEYTRKTKYKLGSHGAKAREQRRLKELLGKTVSGKTHESEHIVGYEVLSRGEDTKRGSKGHAREIENHAPAYQEVHGFHRDHIGTGTTKKVDGSGFNSYTYRDTQRNLIESGNPGLAMQINQLGYSFLPDFKYSNNTDLHQSNESFSNMLESVNSFKYVNNHKDDKDNVIKEDKTVSLNKMDHYEVLASRAVSLLKRYLTGAELGVLSQMVMTKEMDFDVFVKGCSEGAFDYKMPDNYLDEDNKDMEDIDEE